MSTEDDPQPAASDAGQSESEPWFVRSRFWDPTCVSAKQLHELELDSGLWYEDAPLHYLEAYDSTAIHMKFDTLANENARQRAQAKLEGSSPHFRAFFLKLDQTGSKMDDMGVPYSLPIISITKDALSWLLNSQEVHPLFLESLWATFGNYAVYETVDGYQNPFHLHVCVKAPPLCGPEYDLVFYIRYTYATKHIRAIVGRKEESYDLLTQNVESNGPPQDPFGIASLLVYDYFLNLGRCAQYVAQAISRIETETGRGSLFGVKELRPIPPERLDLARMHEIADQARISVYLAQSLHRLIGFLLEEHMRYIKQRNATHFDRHKLIGAERAVQERLKSLKQQADGLLAATLQCDGRIQRQLSSADSIINQSDNKISLRNAESNTKIAEQSKRIAEETRRDSTSMKTIASLTMVYLPSTFAATVFSTGFFTYESDTNEAVLRVNAQIWRFVVTSLILSILTVGIWIWINKRGVPRQLNWARQMDVKDILDEDIELAKVGAVENRR